VSPLIRALIDSHALRHNLRLIRARAAGARVIAVVKANAYGHGIVGTALALEDADALAVARLEEALALRAAGIGARILLLEGVFSPAELAEAVHEGLDLVVHDAAQIELLERSPAGPAERCALWL
jgi:alanine racemase